MIRMPSRLLLAVALALLFSRVYSADYPFLFAFMATISLAGALYRKFRGEPGRVFLLVGIGALLVALGCLLISMNTPPPQFCHLFSDKAAQVARRPVVDAEDGEQVVVELDDHARTHLCRLNHETENS